MSQGEKTNTCRQKNKLSAYKYTFFNYMKFYYWVEVYYVYDLYLPARQNHNRLN